MGMGAGSGYGGRELIWEARVDVGGGEGVDMGGGSEYGRR